MNGALGISGAFVIAALFVAPPLLCLLTCVRRYRRLAERGTFSIGYLSGMVASGIAMVINVAIFLPTAATLMSGHDLDFSTIHAVAGFVSWIAFWAFVAINVLRPAHLKNIA